MKIKFNSLIETIILMLSLMMTMCAQDKSEPKVTSGNDSINIVNIYYFHTSYRCPTCTKLEHLAKDAVQTFFKDELKNGKITFQSVNVEETNNQYFIEKYSLYTKSLVISKIVNGKEVLWKNLDQIWILVGDEQKYLEYVKREINHFIQS